MCISYLHVYIYILLYIYIRNIYMYMIYHMREKYQEKKKIIFREIVCVREYIIF